MFAACFACEKGMSFELLEKMSSCGNKLLLTGHGRCNILNLKAAPELKSCYHGKGNFLYPALASFPPSEAFAFIENVLVLKLTEEDNNRIFPVSGKARDVRDALVSFIGEDNIRYNFRAVSLSQDGSGIWTVTSEDGREGRYKNIILATGGMSFPKTGSSGDSYKLAQSLGYEIVPPKAALAPVRISGRDDLDIPAGLTVKGCIAKITEGDKVLSQTEGDVLFTHDGLSGPAVMELARGVKRGTVITLDMAPDLSDKVLTESMDQSPTRKFVNVLSSFIPGSLAEYAAGCSGASSDITCAKTTKDVRRKALSAVKTFTVTASQDPDIGTAYVTAGGIDVSGFDRKTMGSKTHKGLYVIGEALDIDGISGGYNLTACIAGARLAVGSIGI